MSKFFKNNANLLLISFEKSIKYLMIIMIPIAVATMFYSLYIIQLIYGHGYDALHPIAAAFNVVNFFMIPHYHTTVPQHYCFKRYFNCNHTMLCNLQTWPQA